MDNNNQIFQMYEIYDLLSNVFVNDVTTMGDIIYISRGPNNLESYFTQTPKYFDMFGAGELKWVSVFLRH